LLPARFVIGDGTSARFPPAPAAGQIAGARRLRGAVIRYDAPFEPVGLEDWEALK